MPVRQLEMPPPGLGIPLRDVLGLEVFKRTRAEVVYGEDQLDRPVRWVHTSELAEVAPLLKGGELLLTTGLGLANGGPAAQTTYIDELADHGLTALALELGWTFKTLPEALFLAAKRRDLPLIALHEIVPFVEITEEVQMRLVHRQIDQLRVDLDLQRLLHEVLLRQEGLSGIVLSLSQLLGCPAILETAAGQTVAAAGVTLGSHPKPLKADSRARVASVEVLGETWGYLYLVKPATEKRHLVASALEHGSTAVALSLLLDRQTLPPRARLRCDFLDDLLAGRFRSKGDLIVRAGLLGFRIAPGQRLVAFALGGYRPEDEQIALYSAETAAAEAGIEITAAIEGTIYGVLAASVGVDGLALATHLLRRIDEIMYRRGALRNARLAVGSISGDIELLSRSLRDAQATLDLATELGTVERCVTARGMAADRLCARLVDDPELLSIIEEELGPLRRYDAEHHTELLKTLRTVLLSGSSKTAAAHSLHVRRQSLYGRIAKIEQLLEGDLNDPERRVSLILALKAHDLLERRMRA
jgi:purine catabolism regulator